jgi:sigma-B regulation protein RsbU (phosphoserine phosphatase)
MLRSLVENACTPAKVLTKLNELLVDDFPSGRFVTMVYAVLDPKQRTVTFANAGHLPPVLIEPQGATLLETRVGLPLGIRRSEYSEGTIRLGDGARLALYSDGITEATNPDNEEYGVARLSAHLQQAGASKETLLEDVRAFANGAGLRDDATVITVNPVSD